MMTPAAAAGRAAVAALACLCFLAAPPGGAPAFAAKEDKKEKESVNALKKLQRRIQEEQRALGRVKRERASAVELLRTVEQRLAEEEHAKLKAEAGAREAARALGALEAKQQKLGGELGSLEATLAARLVSLYKLGEVGYFRILFSSKDYQDLARRTRFLKLIVSADADLIAGYQSRYRAARRKSDALEAERKRLSRFQAEADARRTAFEARREKKLALLDRLGKENEARQAAIAEMADAARALAGTFEALRAIAPPPAAAPGAGRDTEAAGPRERFSALRGRVPMPVEGRIVKKFGLRADPTLGTRIHSNGITVRAPYGAPVLSVSDGQVLYAGWFRGYGRILITDHGEGYYTLVAHASEVLKQVGDRVRQGELIARVGDSGSLDGPKLYFEIRARGKPVDPMPWLGR